MSFQALVLLNVFVAIAFFLYVWTGVPLIFYIACAVLSFFCAIHAVQSAFQRRFRFGQLVCSQTILWYSLPFSYIGFFGYDQYVYAVSQADNIRSAWVVILISSMCFGLFGSTKEFVVPDISREPLTALTAVAPIAAVQAFFILTGYWGYATATGLAGTETPLAVQLLGGCAIVSPPTCAILLGSYLKPGSRMKRSLPFLVFIVLVLLVQFAWWSLEGRRVMTILLALSVVLYLSARFDGRMTQRRLMTFALLACAGVPCVWFLWDAYYTLRLATDAVNGAQNFTIFDLSAARHALSSAGDQTFRNVVTRPFALPSTISVFTKHATGILWGWNLTSQFLLAVPSVMFPGKIETIGPVLETLWAFSLDVPLTDYSNTLILESYVDFGIVGFPIYLAIFTVLFAILNRIANAVGVVPSFMLLVTALFLAINVETNPNTLFVAMRSWPLLLALGVVGKALFDRRAPRHHHAATVQRR